MLTLKADIDMASILEKARRAARDAALAKLEPIAEKAWERAFSSDAYRDVTGNLRSSVQTGVAMSGKLLASHGQTVKDGSLGFAQGQSALESMASSSGEMPEIDAVAAMPYASEVEARGQDVLAGSMLLAERLLKGG